MDFGDDAGLVEMDFGAYLEAAFDDDAVGAEDHAGSLRSLGDRDEGFAGIDAFGFGIGEAEGFVFGWV